MKESANYSGPQKYIYDLMIFRETEKKHFYFKHVLQYENITFKINYLTNYFTPIKCIRIVNHIIECKSIIYK